MRSTTRQFRKLKSLPHPLTLISTIIHAMSSGLPRLTLTLLGGFAASLDQSPLTNLNSARVQALLAYLALEPQQAHPRETLAALFWPDERDATAKQNLRQALYQLRQRLADHDQAEQPFLLVTRESVQWNIKSNVQIDVAEFAQLIAQRRFAEALDRYRGELLTGLPSDSDRFEEWLLFRREQLHLQALEAATQLAEQALAQQDYAAVQTYARQQLLLEPWREEAHQQLMLALAAGGNRSAALQQYELCERVLSQELGVTPAAATLALAERIRAGEFSQPIALTQAAIETTHPPATTRSRDWGDAPHTGAFHGRNHELQQLSEWIDRDQCQLISLIGMGGIGKTSLAVQVANAVADKFDVLIWRSLVNAPPLSEILRAWLLGLSDGQLSVPPDSLDSQFIALFELLRQRRCLLILDNCESVMQSGERAGYYRAGYEDYGRLFKRIGEVNHQSCLLLTSRELPNEAARLERESARVHNLMLGGLAAEFGQAILNQQGLHLSAPESLALVNRFSGNPLALMLVGDTIQDVFEGNVAEFLGDSPSTLIFGDIREVLEQQFARLAPLEQEILIWLAVERDTCSLQQLDDDIARVLPKHALLEAVNSLRRRSLIEKISPQSATGSTGAGFGLQNVITEYVTDYLVDQIVAEVSETRPQCLQRYALLKAQAKEYIRQSQVRLILQPIAERLVAKLGEGGLLKRCRDLLTILRNDGAPGYAAGNLLNLLLHLGLNVTDLDFSGLSVWQAYLRGADLPDMNFRNADFTGTVFTDYAGSVMCVAFSPDGELLAAGADNGSIYLWQMASLRLVGVCVGHHGQIGNLAFNADGSLLVSGGDDSTVRVWEVASRQQLRLLLGHTSSVTSVCVHPDGSIISGGTDQSLIVWSPSSNQPQHILREHTAGISTIAFAPDGRTFASSGFDQVVRVWDWTSKQLRQVLHGHTGPIIELAYSPHPLLWAGQARMILATASHDQTLRLWDATTGEYLTQFTGHAAPVTALAFSADGDYLMSGCDDQLIRVWQTADLSQRTPVHVLQGHFGVVTRLVAQPRPAGGLSLLVSGSFDRSVRLWNMQTGQAVAVLRGHSKWLQALLFAPDDQLLVAGSDGQTLRVWDGRSGKMLHTLRGHTSLTEKLSFDVSGDFLASGSWDQTARIWNLRNPRLQQVLRGHRAMVSSAVLGVGRYNGAPQRWVATGGLDLTVALWSAETGTRLATGEAHKDRVVALAFRPDGRLLASGAWDGQIVLWDVSLVGVGPNLSNVLQPVRTLLGHDSPLECLAFHPTQPLLASGTWNGNVRVWHYDTGECLYSWHDHTNGLEMVRFSPNGELLASCACDHEVCVWDVQRGQLRYKLEGHTSWVRCIAFNADGTILASGSDDGTVRLWDISLAGGGRCVAVVVMNDPYTGMQITGATGLTDAQQISLRSLGALTNE